MKVDIFHIMRIAVCPPDYFRISWEINPWMSRAVQPDFKLAKRQWLELVAGYEKRGVNVLTIPAVSGLADMCFTANAGLHHNGIFVLSNFRYEVRQKETPFIKEWFFERKNILKISLKELPNKIFFEGQGDVVELSDNKFLMGHGFRTDKQAAPALERIFKGSKFFPLELINPRFYHLDTCAFFIPEVKILVYYPEAFSKKSREFLSALPYKKITLSKKDADNFAANASVAGKSIFVSRPSASLKNVLEKLGLEVVISDTSEFLKSGGSVRCLSLFLGP